MPKLHRIVLLLALALAGAGGALAQPAPAPAAAQPAADQPPPYASPMRAQCGEELRKDADWQANIMSVCVDEAHHKAADRIRLNERHVYIAYGAILVLLVGFVAAMWLRQGKLTAEIKRLEEELRRAEKS